MNFSSTSKQVFEKGFKNMSIFVQLVDPSMTTKFDIRCQILTLGVKFDLPYFLDFPYLPISKFYNIAVL